MISYQYIQDLFTSILAKSNAIQRRFFVSAKGGNEINTDNFDAVIKDILDNNLQKKYPLAFMLPPRSAGNYMYQNSAWDVYNISMFFLKTTYYDSNNQISNPNPNTRTSQHAVLQDWHDMKRCSTDFIRALDIIQQSNMLMNKTFRMNPSEKYTTPVSFIGVDRVSGVRMDFTISLFSGCDIEDYSLEDINSINVPLTDSHPEHNL